MRFESRFPEIFDSFLQDRHIAGRMQQFAQDDTVNVRKCAVVKEYTESGRADLKANDDEKCTKGQVCHLILMFLVSENSKITHQIFSWYTAHP